MSNELFSRLSSLTGLFSLALGSPSFLYPLSTIRPPTPAFFFFFNSIQTSRACSWVWLKSAECLQDLSKEEALGHCHGNFDNPDRVQLWLFRAIWVPSTLQPVTAGGTWCLPTLFCNLGMKKELSNFSYENAGLKIYDQKLHVAWEKDSARAGWVTALLLYCLLTCLFTLSNPTSAPAVLRSEIWVPQGQRSFPVHFLMSPMPITVPEPFNRNSITSAGWMKRWA